MCHVHDHFHFAVKLAIITMQHLVRLSKYSLLRNISGNYLTIFSLGLGLGKDNGLA